jgi:hypothetical protein
MSQYENVRTLKIVSIIVDLYLHSPVIDIMVLNYLGTGKYTLGVIA